ncbi:uncharacterized protein LOC134188998 [Corticium candelabrum]|uniref:uncharacterized protein LOC134188998 n=1 Tax=Corticium candelabrum TaxID=121492 RepID=UPI002E25976E|nr:uncharacterized protein LOC134188998 [Corticium candelabrum]
MSMGCPHQKSKPTREFDDWSERCPFEDCSSRHAVRRRARTERTSLSVLPSAQINIGFLAQQNRGANREVFGEKPPPKVGLDMVIGQYPEENPPTVKQIMYGAREKPPVKLLIKDCVTMRGGEYFFAPAVSALREMI